MFATVAVDTDRAASMPRKSPFTKVVPAESIAISLPVGALLRIFRLTVRMLVGQERSVRVEDPMGWPVLYRRVR